VRVIDPDDDEALKDRLAGHFEEEGVRVRSGDKVVLIAAAIHTLHEAALSAEDHEEPVPWRELPETEQRHLIQVVLRLLALRLIREGRDD
jgi:hypothetical protein